MSTMTRVFVAVVILICVYVLFDVSRTYRLIAQDSRYMVLSKDTQLFILFDKQHALACAASPYQASSDLPSCASLR